MESLQNSSEVPTEDELSRVRCTDVGRVMRDSFGSYFIEIERNEEWRLTREGEMFILLKRKQELRHPGRSENKVAVSYPLSITRSYTVEEKTILEELC